MQDELFVGGQQVRRCRRASPRAFGRAAGHRTSSNRSLIPANRSAGVMTAIRAAASSIASGSRSRCVRRADHGLGVGVGDAERRIQRGGPFGEEAHRRPRRRLRGEGRERRDVLAVDSEAGPAGRQHDGFAPVASRRSAKVAQPSRTCSQLSRIISSRLSIRYARLLVHVPLRRVSPERGRRSPPAPHRR